MAGVRVCLLRFLAWLISCASSRRRARPRRAKSGSTSTSDSSASCAKPCACPSGRVAGRRSGNAQSNQTTEAYRRRVNRFHLRLGELISHTSWNDNDARDIIKRRARPSRERPLSVLFPGETYPLDGFCCHRLSETVPFFIMRPRCVAKGTRLSNANPVGIAGTAVPSA